MNIFERLFGKKTLEELDDKERKEYDALIGDVVKEEVEKGIAAAEDGILAKAQKMIDDAAPAGPKRKRTPVANLSHLRSEQHKSKLLAPLTKVMADRSKPEHERHAAAHASRKMRRLKIVVEYLKDCPQAGIKKGDNRPMGVFDAETLSEAGLIKIVKESEITRKMEDYTEEGLKLYSGLKKK